MLVLGTSEVLSSFKYLFISFKSHTELFVSNVLKKSRHPNVWEIGKFLHLSQSYDSGTGC